MSSNITQALNNRFKEQIEYGGTNKPVNNIVPLVSVSIATYQHGKYIRECLESIISQETNFPYEIIIGEDGSTDETKEICIEYADKYPEKIRLFLRDRELSQYYEDGKFIMRFNAIWNRISARGKYIALCEGDDYWIDDKKLRKQIDFLKANPDYGMVYSKAKVYIEAKQKFNNDYFGSPSLNFDNLLIGNPVPTPTTVFKKELSDSFMDNIQPEIRNWKMGDYPLWLYIAMHSKLGFLDECNTVYRQLEESASNSKNYESRLSFIESYRDIKLFFCKRLSNDIIKKKIWESYFSAITHVFITYKVKNYNKLNEEFKKSSIKTVKIIILRILIKTHLSRLLLRIFWH